MAACAATASVYTMASASNTVANAPAVDRVDPSASAKTKVDHDLDGPFSKQQAQAREAALQQVLEGKKAVQQRGASKVVKLDDKKYVELGREKTDKIFTILVEFGDKVDNTTMFDPDGSEGPKPPVVK
ncbi:immune inhibitor A domain-containing protein, partial [Streptomyces sp. 12297]